MAAAIPDPNKAIRSWPSPGAGQHRQARRVSRAAAGPGVASQPCMALGRLPTAATAAGAGPWVRPGMASHASGSQARTARRRPAGRPPCSGRPPRQQAPLGAQPPRQADPPCLAVPHNLWAAGCNPSPPVPRPPGEVGRGTARPGDAIRMDSHPMDSHPRPHPRPRRPPAACCAERRPPRYTTPWPGARPTPRVSLWCRAAITQAQSAAAHRLGGVTDRPTSSTSSTGDTAARLLSGPLSHSVAGAEPGPAPPGDRGPGRSPRAVSPGGDGGWGGPRRAARGGQRNPSPRIRPRVSAILAGTKMGRVDSSRCPACGAELRLCPVLRDGGRRRAGPWPPPALLLVTVPVETRACRGAAAGAGAGRRVGRLDR